MKHLLLILCILPGCTSLSTQLPDVTASDLAREQIFQEKQVFKEMALHQERLDRISFKILNTNQDLCKKTALGIGAVTHSLKSYSKRLRPAAEREIGAGDDSRILRVRAGSPAAAAGLKSGDYLRGPEGQALAAPSQKLSNLLEKNAEFTIKRGTETAIITFTPETQCDYPVRLKMTPAINAYANGKSIVVTAGMMDFAASDDELAMIIGHELAHNEMGHIRKIITNYALSLGATRYARKFESEADYVGLYYASRAGFDLKNIEGIWRRLARTSARPIARAKTHPTYPDRYVRLGAARDEINAKIKSGIELIPNPKPKK